MRNVGFIAKRELGTFFNSPVAYIVVVLFLVTTGALFWLSFFQQISVLSMRSYFDLAPLFLAFFAPAITMGLFANERRSGTLELLQTMPVTNFQIVAGKFLASLALLGVVFVTTLPYALTLSLLGPLDWGAVAAGYGGLLLLGATYLAIGVMTSSFTRDQVVAILLGFSICFFLYLIDQLAGPSTGASARALEYFSTRHHFQNIARGVIDTRDVAYYLSLIAISLSIASLSLGWKRTFQPHKIVPVITTLTAAIVLNMICLKLPARFDLTENKMFTLSQTSKDAVAALQEPIYVDVFLSTNMPPPFHNLEQNINDLLSEYAAASNGNLNFRILMAENNDPETEQAARALGIEKVGIGQQNENEISLRAVYKAVAFTSGKRTETIADLQATGQAEYDNFEYEFTRALLNLRRTQPQKIALVTQLGGPADHPQAIESLRAVFKQLYGDLIHVEPIVLDKSDHVPDDIAALVFLNISGTLNDRAKFALDQFIARGGNVGWYQSASERSPEGQPRKPLSTNLNELFTHYGLHHNFDVALDRTHAIALQVQTAEHGLVHVSHPASFALTDMDRTLPFTHGLGALVLPAPSTISITPDAADNKDLQIVELIKTAPTASRRTAPPTQLEYEYFVNPTRDEEPGSFLVAAAIAGIVPSYYQNNPLPQGIREDALVKNRQSARLLVVGSGEFFSPMPEIGYDQRLAGMGAQFFIGSVEWLVQQNALTSIRAKSMPRLIGEVPREIQTHIQFINIATVPCFFAAIGSIMMIRRRKRKERITKITA